MFPYKKARKLLRLNLKPSYSSKSIWNPPYKNVSLRKWMDVVKLFMKSKAPNKQVFLTEKFVKHRPIKKRKYHSHSLFQCQSHSYLLDNLRSLRKKPKTAIKLQHWGLHCNPLSMPIPSLAQDFQPENLKLPFFHLSLFCAADHVVTAQKYDLSLFQLS